MFKSLIVACSLLFVVCSGSGEIPIAKYEAENKSDNQLSGLSTYSTELDVREITINNQKYILVVGYHCLSICPSKNE